MFGFLTDCQGRDVRLSCMPSESDDLDDEAAAVLGQMRPLAIDRGWPWHEGKVLDALFNGAGPMQIPLLQIYGNEQMTWSDSGELSIIASATQVSWPQPRHMSGEYECLYANVATH